MGNRLRRIFLTVFVVLLAAVFALFFGQQQGTGGVDVAVVDGEHIRRDLFEVFREQTERSLGGMLEGLSRDDQRQFVDNQTLESLVRRVVLTRDAEDLGLAVTNAELRADLRADPTFQREGRFDPELVEGLAANLGLSPADLLEELRTDALMRKFQRFTTSPVRMSRNAVRYEAAQRGVERTLRYSVFRTADYQARVELPDGATRALLDSDPARVQAAYDARRAEFQQAEQVRARHILFAGDGAEARAGKALERLDAGEPFDKLARELSEDPATASLGGDLGWFPRGILSDTLDAALFDALEPGKHSAPIQTERGWHIALLDEKRAAQERAFSEVGEELAREILTQEKASELAREAASQLLEAARASGDLAAAAQAAGVTTATTGRFHRAERTLPELGTIDGLIELGFALGPDYPVASQLFERDGDFYVVALGESHEPAPGELEAGLESEIEQMTSSERTQSGALWYRVRRRDLERRGALQFYPLYAR